MRTFIDLFAGIGGFHVALSKRGLECVFASEIDKAACESYKANFGIKPWGDICQVSNRVIPSHDVLCAGFPCQPFSRSGNLGGFEDVRGRLFYEIIRIAKYHRPQIMLLENVKSILTIDNGNVKREIYSNLEKIGYRVKHVLLNASKYGIPQQRERVYFVAVRKNSPLLFEDPLALQIKKYIKDIILPDSKTASLVVNRDDIKYDKDKEQPLASRPIRIGYLNKGGQGERIYSANGHAITLSANGGGVGSRTGLYYVNNKVRRLHIDEAKQVMGFEKSHKVSDGINGYRQLGNAVIPPMIGHVYDNVIRRVA